MLNAHLPDDRLVSVGSLSDLGQIHANWTLSESRSTVGNLGEARVNLPGLELVFLIRERLVAIPRGGYRGSRGVAVNRYNLDGVSHHHTAKPAQFPDYLTNAKLCY